MKTQAKAAPVTKRTVTIDLVSLHWHLAKAKRHRGTKARIAELEAMIATCQRQLRELEATE